MKSRDPHQLQIDWTIWLTEPVKPLEPKPPDKYVRVQDLKTEAFAKNQSLIRMQRGYDNEWGKSPWVIKKQSKGDTAHGWTYYKKFDNQQEAEDTYAFLLNSGDYVEG